jgi:hypothetical protein
MTTQKLEPSTVGFNKLYFMNLLNPEKKYQTYSEAISEQYWLKKIVGKLSDKELQVLIDKIEAVQ